MKKLLALLLLFGIVGCSQSELERCVDANSRFKELTLNFFMNEHSEQDLIPDVILNLDSPTGCQFSKKPTLVGFFLFQSNV